MSALNPRGILIEIDGQSYTLHFNANVADAVFEQFDTLDAMQKRLCEPKSPRDGLKDLAYVLLHMINDDVLYRSKKGENLYELTSSDIGRYLTMRNYSEMLDRVMGAIIAELPSPPEDAPKNV